MREIIEKLKHEIMVCLATNTDTVHMKLADADKIITLLKEQEAVPPVLHVPPVINGVPVVQREIMHMRVWCCGSCGVAITDGDKFCRMCGNKVKWNDSDNDN